MGTSFLTMILGRAAAPTPDLTSPTPDETSPTPDPPVGAARAPVTTRDPSQLTAVHVLMAQMVLHGVYARLQPTSVYHDSSPIAAALELLLPTAGAQLGVPGQVGLTWCGIPRPSLIPAVEAGVVRVALSLGSEPGMEPYMTARPDVFPADAARNPGLTKTLMAAAAALHLTTPLAVDADGNALLAAGPDVPPPTGPWLVLACETFGSRRQPTLAANLPDPAGRAGATLKVAGSRVTHLVTEAGVAYLYRCTDADQRRAAIRSVAGYSPLGLAADGAEAAELRHLGIVATAADLGIDANQTGRGQLAARHMKDIVDQSAGLYRTPPRFRHW